MGNWNYYQLNKSPLIHLKRFCEIFLYTFHFVAVVKVKAPESRLTGTDMGEFENLWNCQTGNPTRVTLETSLKSYRSSFLMQSFLSARAWIWFDCHSFCTADRLFLPMHRLMLEDHYFWLGWSFSDHWGEDLLNGNTFKFILNSCNSLIVQTLTFENLFFFSLFLTLRLYCLSLSVAKTKFALVVQGTPEILF